jgi:ATP-dependent DNA helicase RecG
MSSNLSEKNKERLDILNQSNDGFYIANKDLEMRGPGQLSGIAQSGELGFAIADIYNDKDMLMLADAFCNRVLQGKESKS